MRKLSGPARIGSQKRKSKLSGRYAEASSGEPGNTDDSGEISLPIDNALQGLYKKFSGLKRDLIKSIRHSKFIPRMLFKLRYAQGVNTDRRTQEVLIIKDGKIEPLADKVPRGSQRQHPLEPNDFTVICRKWNTPGCKRHLASSLRPTSQAGPVLRL